MRFILVRRLIVASLLPMLAATAAHAELPEPVAQLLQTARIPQEAVGVVVLRGDAVLLSHNAGLSMQPASTMKVITTMVGLEQLGPVFRGRTELRSSASIVKGALQGDLYVRGGADADFNEDVLGHMLQALRNQGIKSIKGDIIFDRQLFQPARLDVEVPQFDEYPWAYYNVIPDALLVNTNLLKIEMRSSGGSLSAVLMPEMEKVGVDPQMKLSDAPCASWENGWRAPDVVRKGEKLSVVLHGTFPKDCVKAISVNVLDRHDYLERLLRAQWSRLGGRFDGQVKEASAPVIVSGATSGSTPAASPGATVPGTPADARLLAEHVSRTLPEIVRDTNKQSDNTLARTIFLSLGALEADTALGSHPIAIDAAAGQTSATRADLAIRSWLLRHDINDQGLVLENGSGLSRLERATPAQMAGVLQAGLKSQWMPEFLSSLPIAAVDGTMRRRLKDSPAAAHARLKTGSLSGVIAVAGYVPDASGQPCVVVAIINHEAVANGAGRTVLDGLIDWVARSPAPAR
jgi:D-alanyl-D-alanine carboxypeptidase/D-alanyl-D-alanine-endopeptidase (penicillin-binding protein 4)